MASSKKFEFKSDCYECVVVGAGFCGLLSTKAAKKALLNQEILLVESQPEIQFEQKDFSLGFAHLNPELDFVECSESSTPLLVKWEKRMAIAC